MTTPRHDHTPHVLRLGVGQFVDQLVQLLLCRHGVDPNGSDIGSWSETR